LFLFDQNGRILPDFGQKTGILIFSSLKGQQIYYQQV